MTPREKFIAIISEALMGIDPSGFNLRFYQGRHFKYSDKDFRDWVMRLNDGREHVYIYSPAGSGVDLCYDRNTAYGKKHGIKFVEKIWFEGDDEENPTYLSPVEYTVLPTITRRQSQSQFIKVSVPSDMSRLNPLTGQPTGESKAARMSLPESQLLAASGLKAALIEVLGPRGGDSGAHAALVGNLVKTGQCSLKAIRPFSTGVDAQKYMKAIFAGAHIGGNF